MDTENSVFERESFDFPVSDSKETHKRFPDSEGSQTHRNDPHWRATQSMAGWVSFNDYDLLRKKERFEDVVREIASIGVNFALAFLAIKFALSYILFSFSTETNAISGESLINFFWQPSFAADITVNLLSLAVTLTVLHQNIITRIDYNHFVTKDGTKIQPVLVPSGQVTFYAGTDGLLIKGEEIDYYFDWKRVQDIRVDYHKDGFQDLLESARDVLAGTEDNEDASLNEILRTADPQEFRHFLEEWKKVTRDEMRAQEFRLIRIILNPRSNSHTSASSVNATSPAGSATNSEQTSEEILIPTKLFYNEAGADWLSFYVDIHGFLFMRRYGFRFTRV